MRFYTRSRDSSAAVLVDLTPGAGPIRIVMSSSALNASDAAKRLGVSTTALRLYEDRGLIRPLRTEAGWRVYGAEELARAAEIVALRALGLSLAEVARVVGGDRRDLERALAEHQTSLARQHRVLAPSTETVHRLRAEPAWLRRLASSELRAE